MEQYLCKLLNLLSSLCKHQSTNQNNRFLWAIIFTLILANKGKYVHVATSQSKQLLSSIGCEINNDR
jgi:hypothetical protein